MFAPGNKLTTAAWKRLLGIRGKINNARHEQQVMIEPTPSCFVSRRLLGGMTSRESVS
jgi:hypothetical protein